ncbi:MAG: hypothetical protein K0R17_3770 [Rariglobus sp.]|nr:hypothetical protein [Rariglobus sp.]
MPTTLPIENMSRQEKLRTMELLWVDLTRDETTYKPPAWHAAVLKETETAVRTGKATFSDWSDAKARLQRQSRKRT